MRLGSAWAWAVVMSIALAAPRASFGQPEGGGTASEDVPWREPAPEAAAEGAPTAADQPEGATPGQAAVEQPAQPAQPGWQAEGAAGGWGETSPPMWPEPVEPVEPVVATERPEAGGVGYWPLVATLGFGGGWTFEGTTSSRAAALTVQPSAFLGVLRHWGLDHGPALALPIGLPALGYDLNAAVVPGYQMIQRVRRDFLWGAGIGIPLLVTPQFLPGLELSAMAAYRPLAGLGIFARVSYDTFFCSGNASCYSLSTFGAEAGVVIYYEWFRSWEPPPPAPTAQPPAFGGAYGNAPAPMVDPTEVIR